MQGGTTSTQASPPLVDKRKFVKRSLLIAGVLLLAAMPQWILITIFYPRAYIVYTVILYFAAFVLLTAVHMNNFLKYTFPYNWISILLIYEMLTLGFGSFLMGHKLVDVFVIFLISLVLLALVMLIAWLLIEDGRFPFPYRLSAVAVIGLISVISLLTVDMLYEWTYTYEVTVVVFGLSVILLAIAQLLITHRSVDVLIMNDALLLGFVIYMDYVLINFVNFVCYYKLLNKRDKK